MKDIIAVENVQRCATRNLPFLKAFSYKERLQKLKLPTLQYRRLRGDMIETYKLMTGKYDKTVTYFMPKVNKSTNLRTQSQDLQTKS